MLKYKQKSKHWLSVDDTTFLKVKGQMDAKLYHTTTLS